MVTKDGEMTIKYISIWFNVLSLPPEH